jgi:hypothetical protein
MAEPTTPKARALNKYVLTPIRQRLSTIGIPDARLEEWSKKWRFFFLLGFGRSGTAFMAGLLNQAPGAHVFHEPVLEDFFAHARAHYSSRAAQRYMLGFRKREIYQRVRRFPAGVYGEVNGTLRCHAEAIRVAFRGAALLHLVRDGRDVVRSTMPRRTMTLRNPFSMMMHPVESDPWHEAWPRMDRFSRICWFWQEENRRLRLAIGRTVQFEQILSSYDYFCEEVLAPFGLEIGEPAWQSAVRAPQNVTPRHQMPKWADWSPQQQKVFREICGEEMSACGYEL